MKVQGNLLLAQALRRHGVDSLFYLMGGPTLGAATACIEAGIRMVDTRHEQAAAMMAHAYARLRSKPGVCMAASGPGAINLTTGLANALVDCSPIVAIGGSSPISQYGTGSFQEFDQVAVMKPVTKWAARVHDARRIPEFVDRAFQQAMEGKPGPVYLDLPGDILYQEVEADQIAWADISDMGRTARPAASEGALDRLLELLSEARRPVLLTGSGIFWSGASQELRDVVELSGIPFYTTPQGRGAVPDDHHRSYLHARSTALREADLVVVLGTRLSYVWNYCAPPRFNPASKVVRVDISPEEIGNTPRLALGICADVGTVLSQLSKRLEGRNLHEMFSDWRKQLQAEAERKSAKQEVEIATDQIPIHPLRLCKEVREVLSRDAILVVDGQEILNYGRQTIQTFEPAHRLNSGPFGTMGVGLPFGVGAKAACPDKTVVVLHGDGSFGFNAMELDTAVRHKLPLLVVISLNGGWTGDPEKEKPGRNLGYTRFDELARALGCYAEQVETPDAIGPALRRGLDAVSSGQVALINVVTDWRARATTASFTNYST